MKTFSGFPSGKVAHTPLPNLFFTELLPLIDDLAELKVTLHIFWRLYRMREHPRCVSRAQLANDTTLLRSLNELRPPVNETLDDGLERGVTRGTLLKMVAEGGEAAWYFPNTEQGRRAVERIQAGDLDLPDAALRPVDAPAALERPNIFVQYERNIGVLTPFISEELRDAEQTYPAEWIEDAFHRAVEQNVRKWSYVRGILDSWAREGRDDGADRPLSREDPKRYVTGPYADYIEH
jgi:DNA replication protein